MAMDEKFFRYSALDSACMMEIYEKFWPTVGQGYQATYDMTMNLMPVLAFMQTKGIAVDHTKLEETRKEVLQRAAEKEAELHELCGFPLNVNSGKQVGEYFYITLGLPPILKPKTKALTTDDLAMQRLVRGTAKNPGRPEAKLVQEIRGLKKLYSTYLSIEFDADNRMRGSYNPRGTMYGRLSSSKTIFGTGMNMQNLPPDFKKFLVADPGYVLIEFDKRQAEWVVVAYASDDSNMIRAIEQGLDVHAYTASLMFHVPMEVVAHENDVIGHVTNPDQIKELRTTDDILRQHDTAIWPRSMTLRQCGKKCMPGDTEVLTPSGWVRLDEHQPWQAIAQWDAGKISFVRASAMNVYDHEGPLNTFEANHVHQITTDEHRLLVVNDRTKKQEVVLAKDFEQRMHWHLPTSGKYSGETNSLTLTPGIMQLLVAIQADGSIDPYDNLILRVDKARKVKRAEEILAKLGLRYTRTNRGFFIHSSNWAARVIAQLLGTRKEFGPYLLSQNQEALEAFIAEIPHWDGHIPTGQYFTTVAGNAHWVQTIAHITGFRATVTERPPHAAGFGKKNLFWVKIGKASGTSLVSIQQGTTEYTGKVYCPTVPSGFFLVRSKGKISVTGNSNHGLNYDEGPNTFALTNEIEIGEAKRIIAMYHEGYPSIRKWYDHVQRQLKASRTLENCFGRRVKFMGEWGTDLWKSSYSMIPQSTVVDSLNSGMVKVYNDPLLAREYNIDILAQVHDSILVQVPIEVMQDETKYDELMRRVNDYTSPTLSYNGNDFRIATDAKVGFNWGGKHKVHNTEGMRDCKSYDDVRALLRLRGVAHDTGSKQLA